MDLTGTGIRRDPAFGVDNVKPDIVTSGGPPTLLPPYHQGGGATEKEVIFLPYLLQLRPNVFVQLL